MRMVEFSHRSFPTHRAGRRRLAIATILVILVLLGDILSGGAVRAVVRQTAAGFASGVYAAFGAIDESGALSTRSSLAAENARLLQELARSQEYAAAYRVLIAENASLRALLSMSDRPQGTAAPILSSFRASPYGTFAVGAGSEEGVRAGDAVATEGGFVVGRIDEVHESMSVATALFAPDASVDALIRGNAVVVEGKGGGNAMAQLSRAVEIAVGDPVIAPTLGGRPIGIVGHVESDPAFAEQTAYISLPVNPSAITYVYIFTL